MGWPVSVLRSSRLIWRQSRSGRPCQSGARPRSRQMAATVRTGEDPARTFRVALSAVADALTAHGFAAHAESRDGRLRIISEHCPFGDAAIEHPVICAVDRGMVKGMLGALYGDTDTATEQSLATGGTVCSFSVT